MRANPLVVIPAIAAFVFVGVALFNLPDSIARIAAPEVYAARMFMQKGLK